MASYFEWKKINQKDYEEIRKAFIIAANDYELEDAMKLFYEKIDNYNKLQGMEALYAMKSLLEDDGK
jgi:hypothetical protein